MLADKLLTSGLGCDEGEIQALVVLSLPFGIKCKSLHKAGTLSTNLGISETKLKANPRHWSSGNQFTAKKVCRLPPNDLSLFTFASIDPFCQEVKSSWEVQAVPNVPTSALLELAGKI